MVHTSPLGVRTYINIIRRDIILTHGVRIWEHHLTLPAVAKQQAPVVQYIIYMYVHVSAAYTYSHTRTAIRIRVVVPQKLMG
jgi:hypothetical protein